MMEINLYLAETIHKNIKIMYKTKKDIVFTSIDSLHAKLIFLLYRKK